MGIYVSMPLEDLQELQKMLAEYPVMSAEIKSLKRQLDGLRSIQSEMMLRLADVPRP